MTDTAEFFAKKKKAGTKKKFKSFNANKIDVTSVSCITHVDAPEVSGVDMPTTLGELIIGEENSQWSDGNIEKVSGPAVVTDRDSKVAELLDMRALHIKRSVEDDVAERLRIEETKAQLARAKEGMAKEAEKLEREKKEKEVKAADMMSTIVGESGSKWLPSRSRLGNVTVGRQPNLTDEELFPDLAAAEKILAEKEKRAKLEQERIAKGQTQPAVEAAIRAPMGWGSKMAVSLSTNGKSAPLERKPLNLKPRSIGGEAGPSAAVPSGSAISDSAVPERKPLNLKPRSIEKEGISSSNCSAIAVSTELERKPLDLKTRSIEEEGPPCAIDSEAMPSNLEFKLIQNNESHTLTDANKQESDVKEEKITELDATKEMTPSSIAANNEKLETLSGTVLSSSVVVPEKKLVLKKKKKKDLSTFKSG